MDLVHCDKSNNKIGAYIQFGLVQTLSSIHIFEIDNDDILFNQGCFLLGDGDG